MQKPLSIWEASGSSVPVCYICNSLVAPHLLQQHVRRCYAEHSTEVVGAPARERRLPEPSMYFARIGDSIRERENAARPEAKIVGRSRGSSFVPGSSNKYMPNVTIGFDLESGGAAPAVNEQKVAARASAKSTLSTRRTNFDRNNIRSYPTDAGCPSCGKDGFYSWGELDNHVAECMTVDPFKDGEWSQCRHCGRSFPEAKAGKHEASCGYYHEKDYVRKKHNPLWNERYRQAADMPTVRSVRSLMKSHTTPSI